MEKVNEQKRAKVVLGILTKRAYVLPSITALCRKRRRLLFLFWLERDANAFFSPFASW